MGSQGSRAVEHASVSASAGRVRPRDLSAQPRVGITRPRRTDGAVHEPGDSDETRGWRKSKLWYGKLSTQWNSYAPPVSGDLVTMSVPGGGGRLRTRRHRVQSGTTSCDGVTGDTSGAHDHAADPETTKRRLDAEPGQARRSVGQASHR